MARTVRKTGLESRAARLRLKPRGRPYFAGSGKQGVLLGYRRVAGGNGSWVVKRNVGKAHGGAIYRVETFAEADDHSDKDGVQVLDYHQAQARLAPIMSQIQTGPRYTVAQAVGDYVDWLRMNSKSAADTKSKLNAYLVPKLGDRLVAELKPKDFTDWLQWAMKHKPKGRSKKGRKAATDDDANRRKQSTLNRVIAAVKACLTRAFEAEKCESDLAWRRLKKFRGVDQPRTEWLTPDQAKTLREKMPSDFARITRGALLTGCRWSELRNMKVGDFDAASKTVLVAQSKSDKSRRVRLNIVGVDAFTEWAGDRSRGDWLFIEASGHQWGSQDQRRPMTAACKAAEIPSVGFHALRHSYASALVQAGTSLAVVAENLGHGDTRMVSKHYGHLAASHVADAIEAADLDF